jgi:hypothetical protein
MNCWIKFGELKRVNELLTINHNLVKEGGHL